MKGTPKGGSRILKEVQNWRDFNIELSEDQMLNTGRNYCKIYVSPYSDLQLDNSPAPKPSGIIRQHILSGLIDIYKSWQKTLEQFDTPYYLKLWLYEERFEKSQVVCGIGPYVNFYDTTFQIAIENAKLTTGNFQNEHERLSQFSWQKAHDLEHHYATDIEDADTFATPEDYQASVTWYAKKKVKAFATFSNDGAEGFSQRLGTVWLGEIPAKQ